MRKQSMREVSLRIGNHRRQTRVMVYGQGRLRGRILCVHGVSRLYSYRFSRAGDVVSEYRPHMWLGRWF